MDSQKVDMYLMTNSKYFESYQLPMIRERLLQMDDDKWPQLQMLQLKDPFIFLVISFLGGELGIDRFMLGDIGLGIVKLITCGGLGIWYIIDLFLIMPAAKERNLQSFQRYIY